MCAVGRQIQQQIIQTFKTYKVPHILTNIKDVRMSLFMNRKAHLLSPKVQNLT